MSQILGDQAVRESAGTTRWKSVDVELPPMPGRQRPPTDVVLPPPPPPPPTRRRTLARLRGALGELALVAVLFGVYKAGRILTAGDADEASANAAGIWRLERLLHLPSELALQQAVMSQHWLVLAANNYYAYVHFPATVACLIWLYARRPTDYRRTRRILAGLTATALVVHVWFPLAPPRLAAGTGLLDTGTLYGPAVYGPPDADALSNQYAAMPSLHVGWAVVVALALVAATRGRLRWLWLAHPVLTLVVVVATGNHYWLDAVVAVALLVVVAALVPRRAHVRRLRDAGVAWLRRPTRPRV